MKYIIYKTHTYFFSLIFIKLNLMGFQLKIYFIKYEFLQKNVKNNKKKRISKFLITFIRIKYIKVFVSSIFYEFVGF